MGLKPSKDGHDRQAAEIAPILSLRVSGLAAPGFSLL